MGDGGVACVPSQHVVERFSICGGNSNGNSTSSNGSNSKLSSTTKNFAKMNGKNTTMKKLKKVKVKKGELGLKNSVNTGKEGLGSNNSSNGNVNSKSSSNVISDLNKDEVEEGELGTLPIENGGFVEEKPTKKHELKSEIEKGEIVVDKWRKGGEVEKKELSSGRWQKTEDNSDTTSGSWKPATKDELEKGEFVPDRWRKSELVPKDDYSYLRGRRYDSAKEKSWKGERDWTTPPPPPPPPSGKYSSEKELGRSGNQLMKRGSRFDAGILGKAPKISSKIVDEDGYELSNGKNYSRDYSSGNRLKRQGADADSSERKHRGECDDYMSSKSRKLSENGTRSMYSLEQHSRRPVDGERSYRNTSRHVSSDRYSSRHYESARVAYDKYNTSPYHSERSPRDRARHHDNRDRSPGHHDRSPYDHSRSPYDRSRHYDRSRSPYDRSYHCDRSRSPYDRSRHSDYRKRSPSYSEWSPHDQARYQRGRTPNLLERTPPDHGRRREPNRKSGASQKKQSYGGGRGAEEKPNQKDPSERDLQTSVKESEDKGNLDKSKSVAPHSNKEEPANQVPDVNAKEVTQDNGTAEELVSMEEDMDICNTPPHDPGLDVAISGKWFYIDHLGEEQGPSRLCDLKKLVEEGFLVSDHLVKHLDSDRWVTVEKAVSPLVTANFTSIVSDSTTELVSPPEAPGNLLVDNEDLLDSSQVGHGIPPPSLDLASYPKDSLAVLEPLEDLHIDERVGAFLDGFTVVPGKEFELVGGKQILAFFFF